MFLNTFVLLCLLGLSAVSTRSVSKLVDVYTIDFERGEVSFQDKEKIEYNLTNRKVNRTKNVLDAIMDQKFFIYNGQVQIHIVAQKWMSNLYRQKIAEFATDYCVGREMNYHGTGSAFKDTNITTCPVKPGIYYQRGVALGVNEAPSNLPLGRYRLTIALTYLNKLYLQMRWYFNVKKIISW